MIKKEEVFKIGIINKPHGVKGEVSFTFTDDIFDRVEDCDYLVLLLDGILVPFFIEEYRFRSDNVALVKFEGIDSTEKARTLTNVEVYYPVKFMDDQEEISSWNYFIGFRVEDIHHGCLGTVVDVDDATMNVLLSSKTEMRKFCCRLMKSLFLILTARRRFSRWTYPTGCWTDGL